MFEQILWPVVSLGGIGLVLGGVLAYASKVFAVEVDPRVTQVRDALPGANCGACGFPGCDGFADAVASGNAPVNGCPVGGASLVENLSSIMGIDGDGNTERNVARVICNGTNENAREKYKYQGITDCRAAAAVQDGNKECPYGCLGLSTCENLCPFDAIHVHDDGIARVDADKCTACGICIEACPKSVIDLVPVSKEVRVLCNSKDKGKEVKSYCSVGCIGCKICVKSCPEDTYTFEDNLAKIDYDGCTNCYVCVAKCPTNAIYGEDESKIAQ